jgi:Flp pilus assembly protein TadB
MRERERLQLLKATSISDEVLDGKKKTSKYRAVLVAKGSFDERLLQSGIELPGKVFLFLAFVVAVAAGQLGMLLGPFLAFYTFCLTFYYVAHAYIDERMIQRRNIVVPQLPAFIDGLASALGTGFNTEGAIIQAAQGMPPGLLRTELDRVVSALNKGMTIVESIALLKQRIEGREIISLCVALQLFSSMGGTMLEPFRRLAAKIRQQQQVVEKAARDLVQVKQAFLIILVLSVGVPGVLGIIQPSFISKSLNDSLGLIIFQGAVMIQLGAVIVFRKWTAIRI